MKLFNIVTIAVVFIMQNGCVHRTAMSDPKLKMFFRGQPLQETEVIAAQKKWPLDATLIDMQQGFSLLRKGNLTEDNLKRAEEHLERAHLTFEDLKQPENFSKAFSPDAKTPYRGRPYERVLTSMMLGLLDMTAGRCDLALPAFKAAEFLGMRWQAFNYGSSTPLVYALMLRCLKETKASNADIDRAREGMLRSMRLLKTLEPMLEGIRKNSSAETSGPARKLSLITLEVGIPSALMNAEANATPEDILKIAVGEASQFLVRSAKKDDPFSEIVLPLVKELNRRLKAKENGLSATALSVVEKSSNELIAVLQSDIVAMQTIQNILTEAKQIAKEIEASINEPKLVLAFEGIGPTIASEGTYNEIAKVVANNPDNLTPQIRTKDFVLNDSCGIHNDERGNLTFVFCNKQALKNPSTLKNYKGYKLWSSDYQASTAMGRPFEKILKGRAQFKLGANTVAIVGAAVALTALDLSLKMAEDCRRYGRNCEAAGTAQTVAAVAGAVALGAFIAGAIVNPEADTRHVVKTFEAGYLLTLAH